MAAEIKQQMTGKWKQYRRDNFDAYLETTSLNELEKKLAKNIKPKVKIWVEPDGETIVHKFNVGIIKDTVKFKLGEEQEREYLGHKGKGAATWKDGKMYVHIVTDGKEHVTVREMVDGDMVATMSCDGVECKSYWKRKEWKKMAEKMK